MSRVGKNPVSIPAGVDVTLSEAAITVKGPLGSLSQALTGDVVVERVDGQLRCKANSQSHHANAMTGTTRALLANMVVGVTQGFQRKLSLVGVGYKAQASGNSLNLTLGFSHPLVHVMPDGVKVETPTQSEILIKGTDKQKVGQVAAEIRAYRAPEPYKGKGVRYADEVIKLKETKKK